MYMYQVDMILSKHEHIHIGVEDSTQHLQMRQWIRVESMAFQCSRCKVVKKLKDQCEGKKLSNE